MLFVSGPRVCIVNVEIVYISEEKVIFHHRLTIKKPITVAEALTVSAIYDLHPEVRGLNVGIFSKRVSLETLVREDDRIEIYRPLIKDPKERRLEKHKNKFKVPQTTESRF